MMCTPHAILRSLALAICATAAIALTGCSGHHDATLPTPTTGPPDRAPSTSVFKPLHPPAPPTPTDPMTAEIERARLADERRLREQFPENRCSVTQPNTVPAEATQQCSGTAGWRKLQWIDRTDGSLMVIEQWVGDAWVTVFTGPSCSGTVAQDDARTLTRIGVPAALASTWGAQPSRCIA